MNTQEGEARSTITSTTGGVMTKDVGAITGDLEIITRPTDKGTIEVAARYAGADEWYAVEGSPVKPGDENPSELNELHERVVEHLTTPGPIVEGNEEPASLYGFPPTPGER